MNLRIFSVRNIIISFDIKQKDAPLVRSNSKKTRFESFLILKKMKKHIFRLNVIFT